MTKYFLVSVCTSSMSFGFNTYDTYEEAYEQMEYEYDSANDRENMISCGDIDDNSAYLVTPLHEYKWEIREFTDED